MLTSLPEKFKERARITAQTGFLGMERVVKAWMKDDRAKIDSYMVSRASQREKKKRSQAFAAPSAGLNDHQPFSHPPLGARARVWSAVHPMPGWAGHCGAGKRGGRLNVCKPSEQLSAPRIGSGHGRVARDGLNRRPQRQFSELNFSTVFGV